MKKIGYKLPVLVDTHPHDNYVSDYLYTFCTNRILEVKLQENLNFNLNQLNGAPKVIIFGCTPSVRDRKRSLRIK